MSAPCLTCGTVPPDSAAFCPMCGRPVSGTAGSVAPATASPVHHDASLKTLAGWRLAGRLLLSALLLPAVALLFRSSSAAPRPIVAESLLPFGGMVSKPASAQSGIAERISVLNSTFPSSTPEQGAPGLLPTTLERTAPAQVGRFVRSSVSRTPLDASVSETILIQYQAPDGAVVVYGGVIANGLSEAATVRVDVVKTFLDAGLALNSYEYGRTDSGDPVILAYATSGDNVAIVWSAGRLVYLLRARSIAALGEFARNFPLFPLKSRIAWQANVFQAYAQASRESKPLVVYFFFKTSVQSERLAREVLGSDEMNSLATQAIFAQVDVEADDDKKNVSRLVKQLGLESYPVVSVLDANASELNERGRVQGYFALPEFLPQFRPMLGSQPRFTTP